VEPQLDEAAQRAELGFRTGVNRQSGATECIPTVVSYVLKPVELVADVAPDLQAGLCPRNIEEACAVDVTDAHILHRLRLRNEDGIGGLRTRHADYCRRGANE